MYHHVSVEIFFGPKPSIGEFTPLYSAFAATNMAFGVLAAWVVRKVSEEK